MRQFRRDLNQRGEALSSRRNRSGGGVWASGLMVKDRGEDGLERGGVAEGGGEGRNVGSGWRGPECDGPGSGGVRSRCRIWKRKQKKKRGREGGVTRYGLGLLILLHGIIFSRKSVISARHVLSSDMLHCSPLSIYPSPSLPRTLPSSPHTCLPDPPPRPPDAPPRRPPTPQPLPASPQASQSLPGSSSPPAVHVACEGVHPPHPPLTPSAILVPIAFPG